jgi:hypothetical protein
MLQSCWLSWDVWETSLWTLSKKPLSGTGLLRSLTGAAVDVETQSYPEVTRAKTYQSVSREQEI